MRNFAIAAVLTVAGVLAAPEAPTASAQQSASTIAETRKDIAKKVADMTVKHVGKNKDGWTVAETPHFRIFHKESKETAERIARIAETTRLEMFQKWFGNGGEKWEPICELILHPDANSYTHMTGVSANSPGHSRIESDPSGRVVSRRMDVRTDVKGWDDAVLPHEATHVVFAGQFEGKHVPRWADEGTAVLSEPEEKIELHRRNMRKLAKEQGPYGLKAFMELEEYPHSKYIGLFYAQSVTVTEFLVKKKGAMTFTAFVRHGVKAGDWETAAKKQYGMTLAELDAEWKTEALTEKSAPQAAPKTVLPPQSKKFMDLPEWKSFTSSFPPGFSSAARRPELLSAESRTSSRVPAGVGSPVAARSFAIPLRRHQRRRRS